MNAKTVLFSNKDVFFFFHKVIFQFVRCVALCGYTVIRSRLLLDFSTRATNSNEKPDLIYAKVQVGLDTNILGKCVRWTTVSITASAIFLSPPHGFRLSRAPATQPLANISFSQQPTRVYVSIPCILHYAALSTPARHTRNTQ